MVKELLLGDNPFIGVSHLSQEKAREEIKEATIDNKVKIIKAAIESGATGFTFSTHENNLKLLTYLKKHKKEMFNKLNYYILVPYAQSYIRMANIKGTPALMTSISKSMIYTDKSIFFNALLALISLRLEKFFELFIKAELAPYLKILPKENIKAILLHEVLTDLIIAYDLIDLIEFLNDEIKNLGISFGLETRNFGYLYQYILKLDSYYPEYLMTPFNPLGYQMAPNKEVVEEAINDLGKKTKIIAINILASGALSLSEAMEYISKYKNSIYAVATASIKIHRIYDNFRKLHDLI